MASARRLWRGFWALSRAHRKVFAEAWLLLPLTAIGLRVWGFRQAQSALLPAENAAKRRDDFAEAQAVARLVRVAASWSPLPATCLVRSLVLCRLLRRHGLAADLRIGVSKPDGRFSAHAWVEHGDVAVNDSEDVGCRFAAFDSPVLSGGINVR